VYPLPENVGITPEVDRGDVVARVAAGSPAERAGLRKGDRLLSAGGRPVASFADLQYALHRSPPRGQLALAWQREGRPGRAELALAEGWRKTDVSWRWSLRSLDPPPWVQGDDLSAQEKKKLGLGPTRLAFRQGPFVSLPARQAGIRPDDVIVGLDGKILEMTERQFSAYVRLEHKVGDRVVYNIVRDGSRLDVSLRLLGR
jgi:S1-C subfamily serine protease